MLSRVRSQLTYANVMATVAVFLALGGGIAWALGTNSVKSKHIKDGQVRSDDLDDAAQTVGFAYDAATGDDVQEEILSVGDYAISAACESVGGRPSVEFFIDFPEDGRLVGYGIDDPSTGPGTASSGSGVSVDGDTPFDAGNVTAPSADQSAAFGTTFAYIGQPHAATITLHALADDLDSQCRLNGTLTPGIMQPAT